MDLEEALPSLIVKDRRPRQGRPRTRSRGTLRLLTGCSMLWLVVIPAALPADWPVEPAWVAPESEIGYLYNTRLAAEGDLDGDGYDDFVLWNWEGAGDEVDKLTTFLGGAAGPVEAWSLTGPTEELPWVFSLFPSEAPGRSGLAVLYDDRSVLVVEDARTAPDWESIEPIALLPSGASTGSLTAVGDTDGDGVEELLAGDSDYGGGGTVWLIAPDGSGEAWWEATETTAGAALQPVGRAGDVNGDGHADFLTRASSAVTLWLGGPSAPTGSWTSAEYLQYGWVWAKGGKDLDADGFDDVVLHSDADDADGIWRDVALEVYAGGSGGLSEAPEIEWSSGMVYINNRYTVEVGDDVSGDGLPDVLLGFSQAGPVAEWEGVVAAMSGALSGSPDIAYLRGGATNRQLGVSHWSVGDVDGDGRADSLAVSDSDNLGYEPSMALFTADQWDAAEPGAPADPVSTLGGEQIEYVATEYHGAGGALAAGDLNCDGLVDLAMGFVNDSSRHAEADEDSEQHVYVLAGSRDLVPTTYDFSTAGFSFGVRRHVVSFGADILVTDVDQDGCDDLLVTESDPSADRCAMRGYRGRAGWNGFDTDDGSLADWAWTFTPVDTDGDEYSAGCTYAGEFADLVELGPIDGDIDGDGVLSPDDDLLGMCVNGAGCYLAPRPTLAGRGDLADIATLRLAWSIYGVAGWASPQSFDYDGDGATDLALLSSVYGSSAMVVYRGPVSANGHAWVAGSYGTPLPTVVYGYANLDASTVLDVGPAFFFPPQLDSVDREGLLLGSPMLRTDNGTLRPEWLPTEPNAHGCYLLLPPAAARPEWGPTETALLADFVPWCGEWEAGEVGGAWQGAAFGDLNGDGEADLVIGDPQSQRSRGATYVSYGPRADDPWEAQTLSATGAPIDAVEIGGTTTILADWDTGEGFGERVLTLDINADGLDDLVMASEYLRIVIRLGEPTDRDGDGAASAADLDGDGRYEPYDCDDTDPGSYPMPWFTDVDGDGFGPDTSQRMSCTSLAGEVAVGGDCDDSSAYVNPGAVELPADGIDSDCDGGDTCFTDGDGDGARTEALTPSEDLDCADPGEAHTVAELDCDDDDATVSPSASEVADDGIDQDCDGVDAAGDEDGEDTEGPPPREGCGCAGVGAPASSALVIGFTGLLACLRRRQSGARSRETRQPPAVRRCK